MTSAQTEPLAFEAAHVGDYHLPEDIDPQALLDVFRKLAFFDDLFLNMQAMNVSIVDDMVMQLEYDLLREWREEERTPSHSMMRVSALSQMWIFATYELIRTWRERIRDFRASLKEGTLQKDGDDLIAESEKTHNVGALIRGAQMRNVAKNPKLLDIAEEQQKALDRVWKYLSALRINLAKHEAPGNGDLIANLPGYGRINSFCGSIDFEVLYKKGASGSLSRRDIAEELRSLKLPPMPE